MKVKECWLGGNNERREGRVSSGGSRRQPPGEREKAAARGEREERGERRVACVRACVRESCVCVEFVYDGRKAGIGGDAARRRASKPTYLQILKYKKIYDLMSEFGHICSR